MQLTVGEIVEGKVTGITSFGVFVSLGENQSGMVHISEVAPTYVNDIREHVKEGDVVKMRVLNIGEDGKISLSIKRAQEQKKPERKPKFPPKPDNSFVWTQHRDESASFEDMMSRFKSQREEKMADLDHETNNRRGGGYAPRSRRGR